MEIKEIIKTITDLEDEIKIVVNIGGLVLVLGKEIAKILETKGMMTEVKYLEIIQDSDDRDAIARAKIQAYIDS